MKKIITVWGSTASGKSAFSCILAKALTKDKKKAIIISNDTSAPMMPIWLPGEVVEASHSIGMALSSLSIDSSVVAQRVVLLKTYPFIGLLGYCAGDTPLTYPDLQYEKVVRTIQTASSLVDYIIIDCNSHVKNIFVPAGIELADVIVRILTPDLKGVNYLKAHEPILKDSRFRFNDHLTFAGQARPYHPIEEMGHLIGGFDGILPFAKEIDRCYTSGDMFQAIQCCGKKYLASVNKVLEAVEN